MQVLGTDSISVDNKDEMIADHVFTAAKIPLMILSGAVVGGSGTDEISRGIYGSSVSELYWDLELI